MTWTETRWTKEGFVLTEQDVIGQWDVFGIPDQPVDWKIHQGRQDEMAEWSSICITRGSSALGIASLMQR